MDVTGRPRPAGVTALAVLQIISGALFLFLGTALFVAAEFLRARMALRFEFLGLFLGGLFVLLAAVNFILAWGYLSGMGWARVTGLIFASLGVIGGLITFPAGILNLIINGLIIYYLTRPHVYRWFKGEKEVPPPQRQETAPPPPQQPIGV